jgi:hypothetical protein
MDGEPRKGGAHQRQRPDRPARTHGKEATEGGRASLRAGEFGHRISARRLKRWAWRCEMEVGGGGSGYGGIAWRRGWGVRLWRRRIEEGKGGPDQQAARNSLGPAGACRQRSTVPCHAASTSTTGQENRGETGADRWSRGHGARFDLIQNPVKSIQVVRTILNLKFKLV